MVTTLENFLGNPVSELLATEPFCHWKSKRSLTRGVEKEPIVHYEFPKRGFELRCCDSEDNIATIFITLRKGYDPSAGTPFDIPFSWTREKVRERFGTPERSGESSNIGRLNYGPWDRFLMDGFLIRFGYQPEGEGDGIAEITLMTPAHAP